MGVLKASHPLLVAVCLGIGFVTSATQAATVFSDTFGTSTLNASTPAAPSATSTNYQVLSSKNATGSSIAPSALNLVMAQTSSGFAEMQARFNSTPVALSNSGNYVKMTITFTQSGLSLTNSTLNVGLYNSGGSAPIPGTQLNNAQ